MSYDEIAVNDILGSHQVISPMHKHSGLFEGKEGQLVVVLNGHAMNSQQRVHALVAEKLVEFNNLRLAQLVEDALLEVVGFLQTCDCLAKRHVNLYVLVPVAHRVGIAFCFCSKTNSVALVSGSLAAAALSFYQK